MLPEDAWWPMWLGAPDGLVRGDDEVHTEVVEGFGGGLGPATGRGEGGGGVCEERADGVAQYRVWPKHAGLDQEGNFQVGESSALADACALAVHGYAAADDQV